MASQTIRYFVGKWKVTITLHANGDLTITLEPI
jgi:hypothetical protein